MSQSFGQIWDTLSALDISAKVVEKPGKGNPTYLSWGDAWGLLMQHFPEASYRFLQSNKRYDGDEVFEALNGSAEVRCIVSIGGNTRDMWLPIMDHSFKAIVDPDAREVSDAKMRCLVKCLALFGLGHSLYAKAKEDVPDESREPRSNTRRQPLSGARGEGRDTAQQSRPSEPRKPLADRIPDNTALALIREADSIEQLEDRYDEQVAEARKRGRNTDELRRAYEDRRDELEAR